MNLLKMRLLGESWRAAALRAPDGENAGGGGAGGAADFTATLPEPIRGHEALKGVRDAGDLASRFVSEVSKPFAERLPEKYRADPNFKDIKGLDTLADSFVHAQKLLGVPSAQLLRLPADDKDEAGWAALHDRLGRPAAPDKYDIGKPAQGDWSEGDKAFHADILPVLHKAGLSQRQVAAIVPEWNKIGDKLRKAADDATQTRIADVTKTLKADPEFGGAKFDANMAAAEAAIVHYETQLKLPGLSAELKASGLNNSPSIIKWLARLGANLREDGTLAGGGGSGGGDLKSPAEAKRDIASLRNDEKFMAALNAKSNPGHADAVERMRVLYEQAYPAA